jgi:hypothetical protein
MEEKETITPENGDMNINADADISGWRRFYAKTTGRG